MTSSRTSPAAGCTAPTGSTRSGNRSRRGPHRHDPRAVDGGRGDGARSRPRHQELGVLRRRAHRQSALPRDRTLPCRPRRRCAGVLPLHRAAARDHGAAHAARHQGAGRERRAPTPSSSDPELPGLRGGAERQPLGNSIGGGRDSAEGAGTGFRAAPAAMRETCGMPATSLDPVLITGCSSGIGAATADLLVKAGHTVYATARRPETLADLESAGARTLALDVTSEESMTAAVKRIEDECGRVGTLVNNAGYGEYGTIEEADLDRVRAMFETNVFGLARLTQLGAAGDAPGTARAGGQRQLHGWADHLPGRRVLPRHEVRGGGHQRRAAQRGPALRHRRRGRRARPDPHEVRGHSACLGRGRRWWTRRFTVCRVAGAERREHLRGYANPLLAASRRAWRT